MIETALVYIHSVSPEKRFVGCGTLIEGGYVATCRHVWNLATREGQQSVEIEYPRPRNGDVTVRHPASLADACDIPEISAPDPIPDLVLLWPEEVPSGVVSVQLALDKEYEVGPCYAFAGRIDADAGVVIEEVEIKGTISPRKTSRGRRQFTGSDPQGYWPECGSSGAPVFLVGPAQHLAGIISHSELGANDGKSPLREAFVVPATTMRKFVEARLAAPVAEREHIDPGKLQAVLAQIGAGDVPVSEIPARLAQFVEAAQARAAEPVRPTNDGADIEAAIAAARDRLGSLDTVGALARLQETIAAEEEAHALRLLPLMWERLVIERLTYDHDATKRTLDEITCLAPDDVWAWIDLGDLWRVTGPLERAIEAYRQAEAAARRTGDENDLAASHIEVGDVLLAEGKHKAALETFRAGLAIREALARRDPGNAEWQRDLSISHNEIGDVLLAKGEREAALDAYRAGLAIAEALARRDPGNAEWQRDLFVSCVKLADASLPEARALNARALAIARDLDASGRLAQTDTWILAELERRLTRRPTRRSTTGRTRRQSRRAPPHANGPGP